MPVPPPKVGRGQSASLFTRRQHGEGLLLQFPSKRPTEGTHSATARRREACLRLRLQLLQRIDHRRLPSPDTDQLPPLLVDIQTLDLPAGICPGALSDMVALCFMIPPSPVFLRRRGQFSVQYSFDLLKTKRNFSLAFRQVAQVILKRSVFASHNYSFLYNGSSIGGALKGATHGHRRHSSLDANMGEGQRADLFDDFVFDVGHFISPLKITASHPN